MLSPQGGDVVEIAPNDLGELPRELIVGCFRAARTRRVALILNRVPYALVNAALDRHVPFPCLAHAGVRYLSFFDASELRAALAGAGAVWIATGEGRRRIAALGWAGPVRDPRDAVASAATDCAPPGTVHPAAPAAGDMATAVPALAPGRAEIGWRDEAC